MKKVYLDYAATTDVLPEVLEAMHPYFCKDFANPSSIYSFTKKSKKKIEEAREIIANFINAGPEEIFFTSGGTESNNFALKGLAFANKDKNHIITTSIEHPSVLEGCRFLEFMGYDITYLPVDKYGIVDLLDIKKAIKDKTFLISIMHANNEIGTILPIDKIGLLAKENNVLFHTDAIQTLGKIHIDVKKLNIDLLSGSAHKLHGPKGIGFLYIRKGVNIIPLLHGGGQENKKRASTYNVAGIIGFSKAVEIIKKQMVKESCRIKVLRDRMIELILKNIKNTYLNGHPKLRLFNNVNVSIDFVEGEALVLHLDNLGIYCSTGSACSSLNLTTSHVLEAIKVSANLAQSSLRFSLGKGTSEEDIDYTVASLIKVVKKLREISPKGKYGKL